MIEGAVAAVAAPSGDVAQLKLSELKAAFSKPDDQAVVKIYRTAGPAGAQNLAFARLWARNVDEEGEGVWFPLGTGTGADKGKLNEGAAIDGTGGLVHAEPVFMPLTFDEIYIELGAFTGAALAVNVEMVFPRRH